MLFTTMFCVVQDYSNLKWTDKNYIQKISTKSHKTEIEILANPYRALNKPAIIITSMRLSC